MALNTPGADFLAQIDKALPGVLHPVSAPYLEEPRGLVTGQGAAVLKPRTTSEVATILTRAQEARVGVIPYAGGTGLVGGQISPEGPPALILSLERMNGITALDRDGRTLLAGAGAILADIQAAAAAADLLFPLSLASEGSCRIGGNLATNAGGVNVIRYGNARDQCLGIEAVLADGTVIDDLKPLRKDNSGYDLRNLLIGSEGTLGIITAARLKLVDRPREQITALLDIGAPAQAVALLRHLQGAFAETLSAFELIDRTGIDFLAETMPELSHPPTGSGRWLALVEIGAGPGAGLTARFENALADAMETGLVQDGHLAQSEAQRSAIWALRENLPEANRRIGAIASHDISLPIAAIPEFITTCHRRILDFAPDLRVHAFGHLGDGNLHYNIFPPRGRAKSDYLNSRSAMTEAVHDLTADYGGSFSAEHGVGRQKREDLKKYGDPGLLAAMRQIKKALDPSGILNPGAIF